MPKIVRSIRGEDVDFDLIKIKQEMALAPAPIAVKERKTFIDSKLQRRIRKAKEDIAAATKKARNGLINLESNVVEDLPKKKVKPIKKVKNTDDETVTK